MSDIAQLLKNFKNALGLEYYFRIHHSFLKEILPEKFGNISVFKNPYLFFKLRSYIEKKLNLKPLSPELCNHPFSFLITLEPEDCVWLSKTLGALCLSHEIKRVITPTEKTNLINFLGKGIYDFTLKQAELYRPFLPDVNIEPSSASLIDKMSAAGHFLLEYLWCQQPGILAKYFMIKMDKSITWNFKHAAQSEMQYHLLNLCKRLLSQKGPEKSC